MNQYYYRILAVIIRNLAKIGGVLIPECVWCMAETARGQFLEMAPEQLALKLIVKDETELIKPSLIHSSSYNRHKAICDFNFSED